MPLGYVNMTDGEEMDLCLSQVVTLFEEAGIKPSGAIHAPYKGANRSKCDMDLKILPDGPVLRISQDLGELSTGCRLDSAALEAATAEAAAHSDGATVLVVNKFGKHEAEGRGFVPLIVEAMENDKPVVIGVNGLNLDAFLSFSGGMAERLDADPHGIVQWVQGS
ncbi:DUF2478 domain-containing protein [Agrobacterium sp.]|jgi:hypothetical protein|uniref:DUF2478 domain-containing protein n=1 Tax=Agrobacterium sp. TaxID=361 RepID=UPI0028A600E2